MDGVATSRGGRSDEYMAVLEDARDNGLEDLRPARFVTLRKGSAGAVLTPYPKQHFAWPRDGGRLFSKTYATYSSAIRSLREAFAKKGATQFANMSSHSFRRYAATSPQTKRAAVRERRRQSVAA